MAERLSIRACLSERFLSSIAAAMLELKGKGFAHAKILAGKF